MHFPWLKSGLRALAVLLPFVATAQPQGTSESTQAPPRQVVFSQRGEAMVDITKACPDICVEMRYATERNVAGKVVYPLRARALIRKSVAKRLQHAQDELHKVGLGLKIWDAYRPAWAQDALWKALPDTEHLANPARGGSYHTWGTSVDVTLVDLQGHEQKMASDFDDFSLAAKSAYVGSDPGVAARMKVLRTAMLNAGFNGIRDEWWHFTARDAGLFAPVDMPLEEGGTK
jgi:zinc D-Ala-D-Ala dipeptidase